MSLPILNSQRERNRLFKQMFNSIKSYPMLCFSLTLYWVWQIAFFQSPVLYTKESLAPFAGYFKLLMLAIGALAYLVLTVGYKKANRVASKKALMPTIATLMVIGSLLYACVNYLEDDNLLLVVLSAFFVGVGAALFVVELGRAFSQLGSRYSLYFGVISIMVGTFIYYLLIMVPPVTEVVLVIIPPIAVFLLNATLRRFPQKKLFSHGIDKEVRTPKKLVATTFIHGFGLGAVSGVLDQTGEPIATPEIFILAFVVGAIALMITAIVLRMDFNHLVYQIGFPLMGLGFLLLACIPSNVIIGGFILTVSYCFMYTIITCINAHFSHVLGYPPVWIVSLTTFFLLGGQISGAFLSTQITVLADVSFTASVLMSAVMAFLVPTLALLLLSNDNTLSGWGAIHPNEKPLDTLKENAEKLAKDHRLTVRETEIFILLAKGRNKKYISEELSLSEETVKTHTSNIYAKVFIHSQQELISLVESFEEMTKR